MVRVTLVLLLLALPVPRAASAPVGIPRLRPQSDRMRAWLAYGRERSPSLAGLADRIEHSDVVAYLEVQRTLAPGVQAGVSWIGTVPGTRYLRISIRPDLRFTDAVAMLAHELQHVVEVADHPDVQSPEGLTALYRRIGHSTSRSGLAWDTEAALRAGTQTRSELSISA